VPKKIIESTSRFAKIIKPIIQGVKYPRGYRHCVMIMGCQRSGTTLISNIFNKLPYARVYGEFSKLSNHDTDRLRLNSVDSILEEIKNIYAPLIVMKPLVESQNALSLLNAIPSSNVLWIYRHYLDVAKSDALKFSATAGHGNLQAIITNDEKNWRCQGLDKETRYKIKTIYSEKLSGLECSSLFWYARNSLYFQQNLRKHKNVSLWSYEHFLTDVAGHFNRLLVPQGFNLPSLDLAKDTYLNVANDSAISPIHQDVEILCANLYKKISDCVNEFKEESCIN